MNQMGIRLSFTPDQICALNNALRREITVQQRLLPENTHIGVQEYIRHLQSTLSLVTAAWDNTTGFPVDCSRK